MDAQTIVEAITPRFASVARRFMRSRPDPAMLIEDYVQDGMVQLVKIIHDNPDLPQEEVERLAMAAFWNQCRDTHRYKVRRRTGEAAEVEDVAIFVIDPAHERLYARLQVQSIMAMLSDFDARVLKELLEPSPETVEAAERQAADRRATGRRNGSRVRVNNVHIAATLGVSKASVTRSIWRIRETFLKAEGV